MWPRSRWTFHLRVRNCEGWFETVVVDANRVEAGIQRIRQLKLKRPVPIFHKTRAQVAQMHVEPKLAEDKTAAGTGCAARIAAGALLGRYHRSTDVKAESVKLYLSQVEAFYDTAQRQMVILEGSRQASEQAGVPNW